MSFMRTLLAVGLWSAAAASAGIITLDTSTLLLDGSNFTTGTSYVVAFQLNSGGGTASSQAIVDLLHLSGGTGFAFGPGDITSGLFAVGTDANHALGIWQPSGSLLLLVDPGNPSAVYTQGFQAGTGFRFQYSVITSQLLAIPDQFTFQLYDAAFSNVLYEVAVDVLDTPEPSSIGLIGLSMAVLLRLNRRRPAQLE
jgi:hypothetical protein